MQDTAMVRNIALIGHGNSGKTSLAEAMLYTAGKNNRLGKIDDGTSTMDYDDEEANRKITISSSFNNYKWKKHDIYLIDTPGEDSFFNETIFAAHVCDSALFVIGAVLGVRGQTRKFADLIADRSLPSMIVVTNMDRERANFLQTVDQIKEQLPLSPVIVHLPIGAEDQFRGVVDLVTGKAFLFDGDGKGTLKEATIPDDMADEVAMYRESLMESIAETDEELIEKFLEEGALSEDELLAGLRKAVAAGEVAPVSVVSSTANKGTAAVLDLINDFLPAPSAGKARSGHKPNSEEAVECPPVADAPFAGLVFKTMADPYAGRLTIFRVFSGTLAGESFFNASKKTSERFGHLFLIEGKEQRPVDSAGPGMIVAVAKLKETTTGDTLCAADRQVILPTPEPLAPVITYAVSAKKGEEEKLFSSISKMLDEDLSLKMSRQQQTGETLVSGMSQVHLEVVGSRIKKKFGVEMELSLPKIPYMETIRGSAKAQGRHKKQSGGRGQFGDCWIEISPIPGGKFEFVDSIVGGVIPQQYRPAVEKGIVEAMEKGVMAGYPVTDVKVVLYDGSYHTVDSSEMAFKIAGSLAFKKAAPEAGLVLLEPIMTIVITVHKDSVGDIMGDLNSRRGKVMGMDSSPKGEIITAQVPMAEIQTYANELTSMTGGLGSFSIEFSHYEEVPTQIADKIVAARNAEQS
ncbi:elongation factor G [Desulfofustis limnaeus]|jgi:elongation factor G|uniref:Elongation factor G n=1 Tax=Desulfofustis limnaeus TaxID=2740163 RepID=A0ABM7W8G1_9BACT|nr:elongation factor G [Desulfofustis limnaeus]MDX9894192.1 elongation factor G [Desulfofustis sp.]BDD87276.1 elongation factor G [Desulfofustis limnaeus]